MKPDDLCYTSLKPLLAQYEAKGRGESIAFLNWFLTNIFRLDDIEADDVICDRPNDRGIDGIYVNHIQEEVLVLQGKLKQRESTIGDAPLRDLAGALTQFATADSVQALLDGGGNEELKRALTRNNVKALIGGGYTAIGVFVCNQPLDANGKEFLAGNDSLVTYDRNRIATDFIDIEPAGGISGQYSFDTSYVSPMIIETAGRATTYVLPVQALELVGMAGIDDGSLFSQNVRQSLGNTKVNKALQQSVTDSKEHQNFPLYHNGVNILCENANLDETNQKLTITGYVVVNGAQSITTFRRASTHLTPDLRVIAKIIKIQDPDLSKKITINSNNQNAIKPRDLKATNEVQLRLREEFARVESGKFDFEIKRGQKPRSGSVVITNEEAGLLLLAFDLAAPESCHQVYKVFDEKYADIFARPAVDAHRIIFLHLIMDRVRATADGITYKPLAKYGLTRFFLLSVVAELVRSNPATVSFFQNPGTLFETGKVESFMNAIEEILKSLVIDLNYEVEDLGEQFDYKGDLKAPSKVKDLRNRLLRSYEKDVARGKMASLESLVA